MEYSSKLVCVAGLTHDASPAYLILWFGLVAIKKEVERGEIVYRFLSGLQGVGGGCGII